MRGVETEYKFDPRMCRVQAPGVPEGTTYTGIGY